ncbi:MAG: hypothetical protein Q9206_002977 [Seirophora lacunosa]
MFCELYYIPFYFQSVKDYRPTITGLALLPITGALLPTSVVTGRLMSRFGSYRWAIWLGWVTAIVGTGLLILLDVDTQVYTWVLVFVVMGLGHGLILISLNFGVQAMADTQNAAYAAAMYTCIRSIGMCFGVAVGGTVFQNELGKHLEDLQLPTRVANDAERFVSDFKAFPKASRDYQQYILAYARSFKSVFVVLTILTGVGGLLSLLIKEHTMNKELDSEHTLRHRKGPAVEIDRPNALHEATDLEHLEPLACTVILPLILTTEKIERATSLEAKGDVPYIEEERWPKALRRLLSHDRPSLDAVIDGAGGDDEGSTWKWLKPGGVIVSYGTTNMARPTLPMQAVMKNI